MCRPFTDHVLVIRLKIEHPNGALVAKPSGSVGVPEVKVQSARRRDGVRLRQLHTQFAVQQSGVIDVENAELVVLHYGMVRIGWLTVHNGGGVHSAFRPAVKLGALLARWNRN